MNTSTRIRSTTKRTRSTPAMVTLSLALFAAAGTLVYCTHPAEVETENSVAPTVEIESVVAPLARESVAVVEALTEEATVEDPRAVIALAIAKDEAEVDFIAQAEDRLESDDLKGAFESLRKSVGQGEPTGEVLFTIGQLGGELNEHDIAEAALLAAISKQADEAVFHMELARLYLSTKSLPEARDAVKEALRLDTEDSDAWNLAGRVALTQSEWQRAEGCFRRAVELAPANGYIHNNLGLLYVYTRDADAAIDSLETAISLFSDDAPHYVYNNLGLAYEMSEHLEEAVESFEAALVLNPFYARAKVNLDRVETRIDKELEEAALKTAHGSTETMSDEG